ncbi:hypothetical protein RIF29_20224 [Crotalaria pallida]|uniref:Uncharacterized protein n=1 Tax=Crotalaria pallida TaxID=3830 RepID=A0AAN9I4U5_CROPI
MNSLPLIHHSHQPLHLSLNHHRSSKLFSSIPFSSYPFQTQSSSSIRASSSSSSSPSNPYFHNPKSALSRILQTLTPFFSFLTEPATVALFAFSLFFVRLPFKPTVRVTPIAPPPETTTEIFTRDQDEDEQFDTDAQNTQALKSILEVKIGEGKIDEAIRAVDILIELEPEEFEWPLLKAQIYTRNGELELAMNTFEDVLKKDPFCVEALHGLMMASFKLNRLSNELLDGVEEAMKFYESEKRDSEARELKLLIAQAKVIEGDFNGAVKLYEEVEKEEPKDFRPCLCQGIVYTMLRKEDEAEKQFEKFRKLVPEDHPYKEYFEDNAMEFSMKLAWEGIDSKR